MIQLQKQHLLVYWNSAGHTVTNATAADVNLFGRRTAYILKKHQGLSKIFHYNAYLSLSPSFLFIYLIARADQ